MIVFDASQDWITLDYDLPVLGNPDLHAAQDGGGLEYGFAFGQPGRSQVDFQPAQDGGRFPAVKILGIHAACSAGQDAGGV